MSVEESTARRAIDAAVREVTAALRAQGLTVQIARCGPRDGTGAAQRQPFLGHVM
ncbi:hypothetical protein [Streptosporangium sp. NPDC002721]|uniref:hypothetical protein n=1 Tax=Streptosporangium sp. NPDC002721 TaxID=3366188 RepID=UPI0036B65FC6